MPIEKDDPRLAIRIQRHRHPGGKIVRSWGSDLRVGLLDIEFLSGSVYRYFDVPTVLLVTMEATNKKDSLFLSHVRDSRLVYVKTQEPPAKVRELGFSA